jgi:16S rRNA (cytidine1402-2'-O)-methyltransferase
LREVHVIVGEDSRRTRKLLAHYDIHTPLAPSLYQGVEEERVEGVLRLLREGKDVALVSDAGTPLICDPGFPLVRACVAEGIRAVPVPGPTALVAALVAAGLPTDRFLFLGGLPRKAGQRRRALKSLRSLPYTTVCFESPHRLLSTLRELAELFPKRELVVARELTKAYEELLRGTAGDVLGELEARGEVRGEVVLVIGPEGPEPTPIPDPGAIRTLYQGFLAQGLPPQEALRRTARQLGLTRREAYRIVHSEPPFPGPTQPVMGDE